MKWNEINTAPKDGTRILILEDGNISIGSYMRWARDSNGDVIGLEHMILDDYWQLDGEGFKANPTHWMSLPDIPS